MVLGLVVGQPVIPQGSIQVSCQALLACFLYASADDFDCLGASAFRRFSFSLRPLPKQVISGGSN